MKLWVIRNRFCFDWEILLTNQNCRLLGCKHSKSLILLAFSANFHWHFYWWLCARVIWLSVLKVELPSHQLTNCFDLASLQFWKMAYRKTRGRKSKDYNSKNSGFFKKNVDQSVLWIWIRKWFDIQGQDNRRLNELNGNFQVGFDLHFLFQIIFNTLSSIRTFFFFLIW